MRKCSAKIYLQLVPGNLREVDGNAMQMEDRAVLKRVHQLIDDALRQPFDGIGKPEPIKQIRQGVWSRRITKEHRLVYLV